MAEQSSKVVGKQRGPRRIEIERITKDEVLDVPVSPYTGGHNGDIDC